MNLRDLRSLSNDVLLKRTEELAAKEREITLEVLHHLREIERRMLYAEVGYSSLLIYCVKVLRYSETAAYRRIGSMRLLKDVPEIELKLLSGELTLTNAAQVQTHFRKVKAKVKAGVSADGQVAAHASLELAIDEKRAILKQVDSLSVRGCQRVLGELRGDKAPPERSRPVNADETQYSVTLDRETEEMLKELQRELHRTMSMRELIKETARIALAAVKAKNQSRKERALKSQQTAPLADVGRGKTKRSAPPAAKSRHTELKVSTEKSPTRPDPTINPRFPMESPTRLEPTIDPLCAIEPQPQLHPARQPRRKSGQATRYISVATKRALWERAHGRCEFIDPRSGRRCEETRHLEHEHIKPRALGGSNGLNNLELLCSTHNKLKALHVFGAGVMKPHMPSLR